MTTVAATILAVAVLAGAGTLPVLGLVGLRWTAIPLAPLAGAVVAAVAATGFVATGGTFMGWFVGLAIVGSLMVVAYWRIRPGRRPWRTQVPSVARPSTSYRVAGVVGALAIAVVCGWCLRGLSTPTVGFDARALWLMRPGWFLQSHHQLLINLRIPDLDLTQSVYPPLGSAATAVAWSVTGNHSLRLGVVVTAILNTCALASAAFVLVECGRRFAARLTDRQGVSPTAPMVVGVVSAVLLIFVAFGVTEPFITNGYADPIWSLAAVGAVAYGLQMPWDRTNQATALILAVVAGLSKNEGFVTATAIIVLIALRGLAIMTAEERRRLWWGPVGVGALGLATIGSWPILMRVIHARGVTQSFSSSDAWPSRAHATYSSMAPYLHVLVLALPLAVVGGLVLSRVRRSSGLANDWWGWAGLVAGLVAVAGALVTGTGDIGSWLVSTVHRVTEFPALAGWWIVAMWAVVASGAPTVTRSKARGDEPPSSESRPEGQSDSTPALSTATVTVE